MTGIARVDFFRRMPTGGSTARLASPPVSGPRWVRRNEDKTHRCPECHAIVTWDRKTAGPRTILRHCGVQWRFGSRISRREYRIREFLLRFAGSTR